MLSLIILLGMNILFILQILYFSLFSIQLTFLAIGHTFHHWISFFRVIIHYFLLYRIFQKTEYLISLITNYNRFKVGDMGNDGGDIPRRKQLVKEKGKVQIANAESIAMGRARFCNLTNQKLKEPLAVCRLGCIFNYENILAALIQKTLAEKYSYIRKLTDIKKVIIERAPNDSDNYISCPITKLEYNGFNKFVAIWTCGHVLSRKAFKEVKTEGPASDNRKCIICQVDYEEKDIIDLNLDSADLQKKRMELLIKKKKGKKQENENEQKLGEPSKKVKLEKIHLNSLERLDGEFRDVIRERSKFKQLFEKKK